MIGGDLLSEGGYGCIFRPEIDCEGNIVENSEYVSKFQIYFYILLFSEGFFLFLFL